MNSNNHQVVSIQPQQTSDSLQAQIQHEQPMYVQQTQPNPLPSDIAQKIDKAFVKALVAIILTQVPLGCFVSIFLGSRANKATNEIIGLFASYGISTPGKLRAANVLARIGKFIGIGFTIYYTISLVIFIINLILYGSVHFEFTVPIS